MFYPATSTVGKAFLNLKGGANVENLVAGPQLGTASAAAGGCADRADRVG